MKGGTDGDQSWPAHNITCGEEAGTSSSVSGTERGGSAGVRGSPHATLTLLPSYCHLLGPGPFVPGFSLSGVLVSGCGDTIS